MKKIIITIFSLAVFACGYSQHLERGGSLGAMIRPAPDSVGIAILQALPGGTAASIGLQEKDVLLKVNGQTYNDIAALVATTAQWREGQQLDIDILRNGTALQLSGKVKGKPLEQLDGAKTIYGAVTYDQGMLRSILTLPEGKDKPPVVFFLQGFSCSSIDYYYSDKEPVRRLVDGWVANGFAVFRVEKPGVGDCKDLPNCEDIGYNYEVEAFKTALRQLKQNPDIDKDQIFLFGHSLGGVTAPLLAADTPVKGIINYGSVATTWYEYLVKVLREQDIISGAGYDEVEANVRQRIPLLYDYLVGKKTPSELEQNPAYRDILSTGLPVRNGDRMIGRHYSFMQEINDSDITTAFKKAACHVLALHGEFDLHAVDEEWAVMTANLVNAFHPGKGSWKILPGTEHSFAQVPSMPQYVAMRNSGTFGGAYMQEHFNPAIIDETVDWMKTVE